MADILWILSADKEKITVPILDTLQKMTNSLLVNVDNPIDIKRLKD
jgi:hypothetical protein